MSLLTKLSESYDAELFVLLKEFSIVKAGLLHQIAQLFGFVHGQVVYASEARVVRVGHLADNKQVALRL